MGSHSVFSVQSTCSADPEAPQVPPRVGMMTAAPSWLPVGPRRSLTRRARTAQTLRGSAIITAAVMTERGARRCRAKDKWAHKHWCEGTSQWGWAGIFGKLFLREVAVGRRIPGGMRGIPQASIGGGTKVVRVADKAGQESGLAPASVCPLRRRCFVHTCAGLVSRVP